MCTCAFQSSSLLLVLVLALWRAVSVCDHTLLQAHLQHSFIYIPWCYSPCQAGPGSEPQTPHWLSQSRTGKTTHGPQVSLHLISKENIGSLNSLHSHVLDHACWRSCQPLGRSLLEPRGPGEESRPRYDGERTIWLLSVLLCVGCRCYLPFLVS